VDHRKTGSPGGTRAPSSLNRALTFWPLLFYGLGVIISAGIYVSTGAVIVRAGETAPVSFLLAGAAALTGLCYADLAARFPEAAGAAAYVKHGFGSDRLAVLVGLISATLLDMFLTPVLFLVLGRKPKRGGLRFIQRMSAPPDPGPKLPLCRAGAKATLGWARMKVGQRSLMPVVR
jgi:hypothetical protein